MFSFENLPKTVISAIFSYISYTDLVKLRLVNHWFKKKCSEILNETFLGLKRNLESEISNIFNEVKLREIENNENISKIHYCYEDDVKEITNIHLRHKILQILKCEISVLYAICERYVKLKAYCFTGGKILDYFYQIMNKNFNLTDAKNPLESHVTMQLFLRNEEFMDYFEEVMEPEILNKNFCPWFGVKLADILDLYVNANYHISANFEDEHLHISARYEILNPESATELEFPNTPENFKKLLKLSRYIRNQMRWHNFFYYIDAPLEHIKYITDSRGKSYSKFCLNSADMTENGSAVCNNEEITIDKFRKTFSRRLGNPCSKETVCYGFELSCSKNCVPARLEPHIASISQNRGNNLFCNDNEDAGINDSNGFTALINEATLAYDLMLNVKVVLPSEDKSYAIENYVEMYHNSQLLRLVETSKEIPM